MNRNSGSSTEEAVKERSSTRESSPDKRKTVPSKRAKILNRRVRCSARSVQAGQPQKEWEGITSEIIELIKKAEIQCEDRSTRSGEQQEC